MLSWTGSEVPLLVDADAGSLGVRIAFSCRAGGVSSGPFESLNLSSMVGDDPLNVETNRGRLEAAGGFEAGSLALLRQVHGCSVLEARRGERGELGEGDALVTRGPGVTVGVLSADCVPVLLLGDRGAAAVHAGRKGLVAGVIEETAERLGAVTAAWIGPAIDSCCYEVGPEVVDAFLSRDLPVADSRHVSPPRAALAILEGLGVPRLERAEICTSCDESFFSYRRDGVTGRQAGVLAWL
jgi:YfiH family protein